MPAQDGSVKVIDGSAQTALVLRLSAASKSALEQYAEDGEGGKQTQDPSTTDLAEQLNEPGPNSDDDDDDEDSGDDDCLDELREIMEAYDEQNVSHVSASTVSGSEDREHQRHLAQQAAGECLIDDGVPDKLDNQWASEQKSETLDAERSRVESEVATKVLEKGVNIQGKAFLKIAQSEMADSLTCSICSYCCCY